MKNVQQNFKEIIDYNLLFTQLLHEEKAHQISCILINRGHKLSYK